MADPRKEVWIDYTNYRGYRSWRRIHPLSISFENSEWHPETQWVVEAVDCDKHAVRDFALASIHEWRISPPTTETKGEQS